MMLVRYGYSLIEFVVAMAIVGILAMVVVIMWPGSVVNVSMQAEQLAADIRYVQQYAMNHSEATKLGFNLPNGYVMSTITGKAILHPATNTAAVHFQPKITFGEIRNLPHNVIAFNAKGMPFIDDVLLIPLAMKAVIILKLNNEMVQIEISPETGAVQIMSLS